MEVCVSCSTYLDILPIFNVLAKVDYFIDIIPIPGLRKIHTSVGNVIFEIVGVLMFFCAIKDDTILFLKQPYDWRYILLKMER